ncbi:MAG: hypothetical protein H7Y88_05115 [Phycisphaerales bacterium]|nr:hypothetical protein [Phycisphaerales bacterium]
MPLSRKACVSGAGVFVGLSAIAGADPVSLGFDRITRSECWFNPEASFHVAVSEVQTGSGAVAFRVTNNFNLLSSITEVYLDDSGEFASLAGLVQNHGVSLQAGSASPGNLPGGHAIADPFQVTPALCTDVIGRTSNGVNFAAEFLEFRLNLSQGRTHDDVLTGLASSDIRLGIHVRGIFRIFSDSFINESYEPPVPAPPQIAPLPPGVWMGGIGLAGLGVLSYFRRRLIRV